MASVTLHEGERRMTFVVLHSGEVLHSKR